MSQKTTKKLKKKKKTVVNEKLTDVMMLSQQACDVRV